MPPVSGPADIILDADSTVGTPLPLMLAQAYDDKENPVDREIGEVLAAAQADSPLGEWLEPIVQRSWRRGAGLDYNAAPGLCTRFGAPDENGVEEYGQITPAGAETEIDFVIAGASYSRVCAIVEYGGDRWFVQVGDGNAGTARVMRQIGGIGALTTVVAGAAGEYFRGAVTADDGAGNQVLFVTVSDDGSYIAGQNGALYRWDGAVWTKTGVAGPYPANFGTNGRNSIVKVEWTIDGVPAWRLVTISGPSEIAYTRQNADPMLPASWVENVKIGTTAGLQSLAAARHHVWCGAADGLFDVQENGSTPNLVGYDLPSHELTGRFTKYYNDYVYMSVAGTLHRIYVGEAGVLQSVAEPCGPCWNTPAENTWTGPITALGEDQGWLLAATYNYSTQRAGIWYGVDRRTAGVATATQPIVWHGPEIAGNASLYVTQMRVSGLGDTTGRGLSLYLSATSFEANVNPWIGSISVPMAGSSLSDLLSAGTHRFATGGGTGTWNATCQLWSLPEAWKDAVSQKIIDAVGITSRGLNGSQILHVYNRADPAPGSVAWGTPVTYLASPVQNGAPVEATTGYRLEYRVDFFSPGGQATPALIAVLCTVRRTAWVRRPAFMTLHLDCEYGDGVVNLYGGHDETMTPDQKTTQIKALTESGRIVMETRLGQRYTVVLRQAMTGVATMTDGPAGKRIKTRLVVAILAAA